MSVAPSWRKTDFRRRDHGFLSFLGWQTYRNVGNRKYIYDYTWNYTSLQYKLEPSPHTLGENGCKRGRIDRRSFVKVDQQTQWLAVQVVCLGLQKWIHVVLHGEKPISLIGALSCSERGCLFHLRLRHGRLGAVT